MSKIVLNDIPSGYDLSKINDNFNKIETALNDKVLFRDNVDGEPNQLEDNIDANNKTIYNASSLSCQTLLIGGRLVVVDEAAVSPSPDPTGQNGKVLASDGIASYWVDASLISGVDALTTSLAAEEGSSLVGFLQNGAGAFPRTLEEKNQDIISVKDYGAVGDGVTDDTAAIQAAIDYAATLPRGAQLIYPAGRYLLTSGLIQTSSYISHKGEGVFRSLLVTATNITSLTVGTNPITAMQGVDVLDIGFYHSNAVVKTTPQLILISPQQTTIRAWLQNGAYGCVVYGGQGILFDKIYAPGNYDVGTNATLNSVSGIVLYAASTLGGYTLGSTAIDLPTEVRFQGIYINGPQMKGWQRGVAIFAGEHITFSGDCYVGQSTINNIHIEQDSNNKLILEVKIEKGTYIDAAGNAAVYVGGPNGNGSQYIGSISIDADVKGQSGDGLVGIYIDGTARGGSFSQAVRNVSITSHVSGFSTHGINLSGGINISVTGAKGWGNSFNTTNNGYGLLIGPNVTECVVSGGHFGGGTYGDGTGNQTAGVGIDSSATKITLNGVDLRGNQSALVWTPNAATSNNRIVNCPGYNGSRAATAPAMSASTVDYVNPYGSPASVLIFGGTVTSIKLNGSKMFGTTVTAPIMVGADDRLNITYSVAPSWVWWPH